MSRTPTDAEMGRGKRRVKNAEAVVKENIIATRLTEVVLDVIASWTLRKNLPLFSAS
jgi:hypothetical protein